MALEVDNGKTISSSELNTTSNASKCATSGSNPNNKGAITGTQTGSPDAKNVLQAQSSQAAVRTQPISSDLANTISTGLDGTGLKFIVTSGGQDAEGSNRTGSTRHDHGNAADGYFIDSSNRKLNADNASDRATISSAISSLSSAGIKGIGWGDAYMGGANFHLDQIGDNNGNTLVWGEGGKSATGADGADWVRDAANGKTSSDTGASTSNASPSGNANNSSSTCDDSKRNKSGGGSACAPISAATPAAAASIVAGKGMAGVPAVAAQLSKLASNPMGMAQSVLQSGLSSVINPSALTGAGLSNVLTGLTSGVGSQIQNIGSSVLSSITGVIPSIASGAGSGLLTDAIQNVTGSIIKSGVTNLGNFTSIFSSAASAVSSGGDLQQSVTGAVSQIFGKATTDVLAIGKLPGFSLSDAVYSSSETISSSSSTISYSEGYEGESALIENTLTDKINSKVNLVADYDSTLKTLVTTTSVDGFSTMFNDYNSLVTQGFGNLSNNLVVLGTDLKNLGDFGDLVDLLNIGTPKQLARQIIERGISASIGLSSKLSAANLTYIDTQDETNAEQLLEILDSINDAASISKFKLAFSINSSVAFTKISDILNTAISLPASDAYNHFHNFRDMALTLLLCGGTGELTTLGSLGAVLETFETVETYTALLQEYAPIRKDEADTLLASVPTKSKFSETGLTIADFIGSAAGYIHADTLPRINTLREEVYSNAVFNTYKSLYTTLTNTINGMYTTTVITVPSVGTYVFGTYTDLDSACLAIKDAIETELAHILSYTHDNDFTLYAKITELEMMHTESARYLAHEKELRMAYGIDIGEATDSATFIGDGSTFSFVLSGIVTNVAFVYVNGDLKVRGTDWIFNTSSNSVIMTSTPSSNTKITVYYDTNTVSNESSPSDAWSFANMLELYATETGYGSTADFLNRIATNDLDGQRIRAIMIQARNKARLEDIGMTCSGFNRVLNPDGDDHSFNFIEVTGIWSPVGERAAEIYVQTKEDVSSYDEFFLNSLQQNSTPIIADNKLIMNNIIRQLIFYKNGMMTISPKMVELYNSSMNGGLLKSSRPDMNMVFSDSLPFDGFYLGEFNQIMTAIMDYEGFNDENFTAEIETVTQDYLDKIGMDLLLLTQVCQRVLAISLAELIGITEEQTISLFGIQSVSKAILENISN